MSGSLSVHPDEIVALVGRARAADMFPELGDFDPRAQQMLAELAIDETTLDPRCVRAAVVRTLVIDGLVRDFFARHPDGLAIGLYAGLCTRFFRVDNRALRWVDVDPSDVAAFKVAQGWPSERHWVASACSLTCTCWMDLLSAAPDVPTLLVSENGLRHLPRRDVDLFLTRVSARMPRGTELVVACDRALPLRVSRTDARRARLELAIDGAVARYTRLAVVAPEEYPEPLERQVGALNDVSRHFGVATSMPSVTHARFV